MFDRKEYMKKWRKNNPESISKSMKKWRGVNLEYSKKYYERNKEHIAKRAKEWHKNNREKILKRQKMFYQENHEKLLEQKKRWRENNPEYKREYKRDKMNEYNRKYLKTEKGKANQQRGNAKRQARERKIINTLTSQEWLDILKEYNYRCTYCGKEFDENNLPTKDHVIPISKGGHNTKENIVPACKSCNSKKHDKLLKRDIKGNIEMKGVYING